jgi:acyl dehydratase
MNLRGEPAHVGRHCGANEYEVSKEVVAFYADALDDHHSLQSEYAPPLLYHSECYQFVGEWYLANLFGNLHLQQDWRMLAPIPVGAKVRTRSTIIERYIKRNREIVLNETDVMDAATGALLVRGQTHQSFLIPDENKGDYVVDESSAAKKAPRPPFPVATGADLSTTTTHIDQRRCRMFSGPGKNYHTDAGEAKKLGFPNIVVQGMMSTCFVSRVMQGHFGMGWLAGGEMSVKLTNVLWVDESVQTHAKIREETREGTRTRVHCDVWVDKEDGTKVILGSASALT